MYTPFAHAICIRNQKNAFFAKITLCMYILCGNTLSTNLQFKVDSWT